MKLLRLAAVSSFAVTASMGLLVACGDDDAVILDVGQDSGPDGKAGTDARSDVNQPDVNSTDANRPDTGGDDDDDVDAGDAGDAGDAADANDGATTFFDASTYDSGPDAGFEPDASTATVQLADVFCNTVARCCFSNENLKQGDPLPGGGTFNRDKCTSLYNGNGFEQASRGSTTNPAHTIVDQSGSKACADKLKTLTCNLPYAEFSSIRKACYGALLGTQGPAATCTVSAECQKGLFCNNPTNVADAGKCELVRGLGAKCGDTNASFNDSMHVCEYRYSGEPQRYCEYYDHVTKTVLPRDQWTCKAARAIGEACITSPWCASGICTLGVAKCEDPGVYFVPNDCNNYKIP